MSVEIDLTNAGIPGLPKSLVITNAAQEDTLKEILKVLSDSNKSIKNLSTQDKKSKQQDPDKDLTNPFNNKSPIRKKLNSSFDTFGKSLGKTAGGVVTLGLAAIEAVELLAELGLQALSVAKSLSTVTDSMVNAANSLDKIPVVGAFLAQFLGAAAESAEKLYGEFTALSTIGVTFSSSMTSMVNAASGAGLTIEQFNSVLKNSGHMLASLGGTTEEGAKRFAQLSKSMRTSGLASELYKMGYTTEQVNSGMSSYIGSISSADKLSAMSTDQLVKGSSRYLKEINMLATITGESREAKQKEMDQIATNVQFQAAINDLSLEDQQDLRAMIALLPEAAQEAAMDAAASGNITTEAAQTFNSVMPQFSANMRAVNAEILAGKGLTLETRSQILDNFILESKVANKQWSRLVTQTRDYDAAIKATQAGQKLQLGAVKREVEERKKLSDEAGDVDKIAKFKQQIAETGNKFTLALMNTEALDTLQSAFSSLADFTSEYLMPIINSIFIGMGALTPVFSGVIAIIKPFGEVIGSIFSGFFEAIGGNDGATTLLKILGAGLENTGKLISMLLTPWKLLVRISGSISKAMFGELGPAIEGYLKYVRDAGEMMSSLEDCIADAIDGIFSYLPPFLNGITKEEANRRKAVRAVAAQQRRDDNAKREQTEKDEKANRSATDATNRESEARDKLTNKLLNLSSPEDMAKDAINKISGGTFNGTTTGSVAVTSNMRDYMKKSAILESTIDPNAANKGSSARGLFQFMPDTWTEYVGKMGKNYSLADRFDPVKSAEVMAFYTQSQKNQFEKSVGRSATDTDLYNAHFLGAGGAINFEKLRAANPNQSAAALFPKEAAQNTATFYNNGRARSLQEVYELHNSKMAAAGQALMTGKYGKADISSRLPFLNALLPGDSAPVSSPGGLAKRGGSAPLATIKQAAANTATSTASAAVANVIPTPAPTPAPTPSTPGTLTNQSSANELLLSLNNKIDSLINANIAILRSSEEEVRVIRGLGNPALLVNR